MKYLNFICYSLLLMLLFNTSSLYAAPPLTDHTTHTPLSLMPEPLSGSRDTFSLAATWWLPDWQGGQGTRGSTDDGGGDVEGECETYGFVTECPPPKTSGGLTYPLSGLTCHKSCSCSEDFKYNSSNCSGNYKLSGSSCDGKYSACVCKDEFRYDSSNCNGENKLGGEICNGKYNSCTLRPECTVSSKDCTYGCAGYNSCSRCTSCKSNPDCDVSSKYCTYGCASYNSCSKCTSCKSNPDCNVTDKSCTYGCASTNSCGKCTSCSGNPDCNVSDKSCDCGCSSTNSCGKCTSCKSCPPADPCSGVSCGSNAYCSGGSCRCNSGYTGNANSGCTIIETCTYTTTASSCSSQCKNVGSSSCTKNGTTYYNGCGSSKCSSGQTCSNGTCKDTCTYTTTASSCSSQCKNVGSSSCTKNGTTYYNGCGSSKCSSGQTCSNGTCKDTCVSGGSSSCSGQTSSCSSSQVQTSSCKDCSGKTHYTCRAKTCSDGGYVSSCPSGQTGTAVSYAGLTCYSNCKAQCVPKTTCSQTYSGSPVYRSYCYKESDGCGGYLTCYREASCSEACSTQECIDNCNTYPTDECWWGGCTFPGNC